MYQENSENNAAGMPPYPAANRQTMSSMAAKRRRMRRNKRRLRIAFAALVILLLVSVILIIVKSCSSSGNYFVGKWHIDEVTGYEFDKDGKGALVLPSSRYDFAYTYDDNTVKINFVSDMATDAEYYYTFTDDNKKLELKGKEGTYSGTYQLIKENKE